MERIHKLLSHVSLVSGNRKRLWLWRKATRSDLFPLSDAPVYKGPLQVSLPLRFLLLVTINHSFSFFLFILNLQYILVFHFLLHFTFFCCDLLRSWPGEGNLCVFGCNPLTHSSNLNFGIWVLFIWCWDVIHFIVFEECVVLFLMLVILENYCSDSCFFLAYFV